MLYTGKGDNGTTKLFGCTERISKAEEIVTALGTIDELNSCVGLCRAHARERAMEDIHDELLSVQEDLFVVQAQCAGAPQSLKGARLERIEAAIARVENEIPPIRSFTIPGATVLSATLDVARTIARRAERSIVAVEDVSLRTALIPYLNRLSSLLFAYARLAAFRANETERAPHY